MNYIKTKPVNDTGETIKLKGLHAPEECKTKGGAK